jgi:hypothetical protein
VNDAPTPHLCRQTVRPHAPPAGIETAGSRAITIGGHRAVVIPRPRDELNSISGVTGQNIASLPGCEVIVIYRPVKPAHLGWVETLSVSTAADRDPASAQCPLSIRLATAAEKRLP